VRERRQVCYCLTPERKKVHDEHSSTSPAISTGHRPAHRAGDRDPGSPRALPTRSSSGADRSRLRTSGETIPQPLLQSQLRKELLEDHKSGKRGHRLLFETTSRTRIRFTLHRGSAKFHPRSLFLGWYLVFRKAHYTNLRKPLLLHQPIFRYFCRTNHPFSPETKTHHR
jgi:hypothetical protein